MPIPKFIVLDLDDTILDYSTPGEAVWKRLFHEFALRMDMPLERLQSAVDSSRTWFWSDPDRFREGRLDLKKARRTLIRDAFTKLGRSDWETADALADAFTRDRETAVQPFDGAIDALTLFRQSGARMVLLTNGESSMQRAKIERFRLEGFFESILVEGETGIGKPDPRAHRAAITALGAEPRSAWMIGDDWECDIAPAKGLGMRTAWIRDGEKSAGKPADLIVPSLQLLADRWSASG
ncbi:MAG: HAD family hydrolase [Anaerolineales bacterium]|nr:HAD family hydrolase [Anaerolineales bacterium]